MSKKDYVKLAAVFGDVKRLADTFDEKRMWRLLRDTLANTLAADNPRFNRERFIKATEA